VTSVTADTNIYISGFEFGGLPEQFLQLARDGAFRLDISESIKREVLRVLRDKFEYPAQALLAAEVQIDRITHRVNPTQTADVIKTDPSDIGYWNARSPQRVISS
jgi:predicted nucleic acid-binding protein